MPIGIIIVLSIVFFILALGHRKHNRYLKKEEEGNPYESYDYLIDNINSCSTFAELCTCSTWVDNLEFQLDPAALIRLKLRMREKEKELINDISRITGESIRKIQ